MANSLQSLYNYDVFRAELLYQLRQRLALAGVVNFNYQNLVMNAGDTASIGLMDIVGPARERAIGQPTVIDDARSRKKTVTFTNLYKSVRFDNLEQTFSAIPLLTNLASRLAARVSEGVDQKLVKLHRKVPYEVGTTDGTAAFHQDNGGMPDTMAKAKKILLDNMIPTEEVLHVCVNTSEGLAAKTDPQYKIYMNSGDPNAVKDGRMPIVHGFQPREVQRMDSVQLSSPAEWFTDPNAPAVLTAAAGSLGDTSLHLDGLGTGSLRDGSTFTIAGHHNEAGIPIGYAVEGTVVIAGNAATITIFPPLTDDVADNTAVTPNPHQANTLAGIGLAFHPDAFCLAVRPQAPLSGLILQDVITDPDSNMSFRIHVESKAASTVAGEAFSDTITLDMLCATELMREEFAVKITGKKQ